MTIAPAAAAANISVTELAVTSAIQEYMLAVIP